MTQLVLIDMTDLKNAVKNALTEFNFEQQKQITSEKLYTINQVRKRLGKAHITIKNLVINGFIKTTKDGLISEAALNEYLRKD